MEIFDVFSMNETENFPTVDENVFLIKVSQTHFSKDFYPKSGPMPPPPGFAKGGHKFFKGGCEVPAGIPLELSRLYSTRCIDIIPNFVEYTQLYALFSCVHIHMCVDIYHL